MRKKKKQIDLIFTRDFSLFTCDLWYISAIRGLKKAYGLGFSDQLIHFNGRTTECYRLPEDFEKLKQHILKFPLSHRLFSITDSREFQRNMRILKKWIERGCRAYPKSFATILEKLLYYWEKIFPRFVAAVYIPNLWASDFKKRYGKEGEKLINVLFEDRKISEGIMEDIDVITRKFFETILKKQNLPLFYAKLLRLKEGEKLIRDKIIPSSRILQARRQGYVLIKGKLFTNVLLNDIFKRFNYIYKPPKIDLNQKEIRGTTAYGTGIIKGKIITVLNYEELRYFSRDSILVTTMTTPEFIPAMKRAKAIITDEGGITCHAAIISRELNIPCIIGTKIATAVLHDGDLVEVDANKGIVRKISKR